MVADDTELPLVFVDRNKERFDAVWAYLVSQWDWTFRCELYYILLARDLPPYAIWLEHFDRYKMTTYAAVVAALMAISHEDASIFFIRQNRRLARESFTLIQWILSQFDKKPTFACTKVHSNEGESMTYRHPLGHEFTITLLVPHEMNNLRGLGRHITMITGCWETKIDMPSFIVPLLPLLIGGIHGGWRFLLFEPHSL